MTKDIETTIKIYEAKIEAINALREVVKSLDHTKTPNKRIETEFKKVMPRYHCSWSKDYGQYHFSVWDNNNIPYDKRVYLVINESRLSWDSIKQEIDRCDPSDSLENLKNEIEYYTLLEDIEKQIKTLQEKAIRLKDQIPTPKAAKLRAKRLYWSDWSYTTKEQFKILFNYNY